MSLIYRLKVRKLDKYLRNRQKELYTWIHRYLRLHGELLEDEIYQKMYDYNRNALINIYKKEINRKDVNDMRYGELADNLADIFNKHAADRVNERRPTVERCYNLWKKIYI